MTGFDKDQPSWFAADREEVATSGYAMLNAEQGFCDLLTNAQRLVDEAYDTIHGTNGTSTSSEKVEQAKVVVDTITLLFSMCSAHHLAYAERLESLRKITEARQQLYVDEKVARAKYEELMSQPVPMPAGRFQREQ